MRKPENKRDRGRGFFFEENQLDVSRKKALKPAKTAKRVRLQDIDDYED